MPNCLAIWAACSGAMLPALLPPSVMSTTTLLLASLSRSRLTGRRERVADGGAVLDDAAAHVLQDVAQHVVVERQRALRVGLAGEDHQAHAVVGAALMKLSITSLATVMRSLGWKSAASIEVETSSAMHDVDALHADILRRAEVRMRGSARARAVRASASA